MTGIVRAWVNGSPAQGGLLADRGLHYGDGLFETVHVRDGRPRFPALHADRLARGCARLGIACDATAILTTAALDLEGEGTLKVMVTRGDAVARGYGATGGETARVIHLWYPGAAPAPRSAFDAVSLRQQWGENPDLAGMKHLNRLEQVMARRELAITGADEGLVRSSGGRLVSGTMSNVFLWTGGCLVTPRVDRCGIEGVMRAVVLREAARAGVPFREADLAGDLPAIDGLAFSNVRLGLQLATQLDGRALSQPQALLALARTVQALHE